MQVVLHCGVYSTDTVPLLESLNACNDAEHPLKTQIGNPEKTRVLLRKLLRTSDVREITEETRDVILEVAQVDETTQRLILSNPAILGTYRDFAHEGHLFPNVTNYLSILKTVFMSDDLEICFAMKNPATLISSVLQATRAQDLVRLIGTSNPLQFRWSELIARIRAHMPDMPITVWYNEDSPLIWRNLILYLLSLPADVPIKTPFKPMDTLLDAENLKRFHGYIAKHPGMTLSQERRVIATFIDKFADDSLLEEDVEIDGWDQAYVDELTRLYEADMAAIARIPNVKLILP